MRSLLPSLAVLAAALLSPAQADLILYDGFNYPAPGNLNGNAGGVGFGANAWTAVAGQADPVLALGSLAYSSGGDTLYVEGNMVAPTGGSRSTRNLGTPLAVANTTLWIGFRIKYVGALPVPTSHAGFSLFGGLDGAAPELFIGKPGFSATNWGVDTSTDATAQATGAMTAGTSDAFLLTRIVYGATAGAVSLWVNPGFNEGNLGAPQVTSSEAAFNIASIRVSTGGNSAGYQFDEFRVGTTMADVMPAVPEPGSIFLVAAGAAFCGLRRRRSRGA